MSEPPVTTEAEGVRAEPRKTGHRLMDISIALSAILISVISLTVAIHHGRVQERLVAANSWPFLTARTSNDFGGDRQYFSLSIINSGVGPAVLKRLIVRYDDKPVRGWLELLQECCGVARDTTLNDLTSLGFAGGDRPKGIVRAREGVLLLKLGRLSRTRKSGSGSARRVCDSPSRHATARLLGSAGSRTFVHSIPRRRIIVRQVRTTTSRSAPALMMLRPCQ